MAADDVRGHTMSTVLRRILLSFVVVGVVLSAQSSEAQSEPLSVTQQSRHYSTSETSIGVLLDDPDARAIVSKHIPEFSTSKRMELVRWTTLKSLQHISPEKLTDEALKGIDAELATLPAK